MIDSTLVSKFAIIPKKFHRVALDFSYEKIEGEDVLLAPSPLWSSCSGLKDDRECLQITTVNCGWCSLFEECMESMLIWLCQKFIEFEC